MSAATTSPAPAPGPGKVWRTGGYPLMLLAGILYPLAFAPFHFWPLALFAPGLLLYGMIRQPALNAPLAGWLFGVGLFGAGASWVYVSIHVHGSAPVLLATGLTAVFVCGLALFPLLMLYCLRRWWSWSTGRLLLAFAPLWVAFEWLRSWVLTGFPWLLLGNAFMDTPLAGWIPLVGVYGVSLLAAGTLSLLYALVLQRGPVARAAILLTLALIWTGGQLLRGIDWTHPSGPVQTVTIAQGNIPQAEKWDPEFLYQNIAVYQSLSRDAWGQDLLVWPETAVPVLQHQAAPLLASLASVGKATGTTLVTGIPMGEPREDLRWTYYNGIIALGNGDGAYQKQRLVPFGEYVPLESWLRGMIAFFDLPMSSFSRGPANQPLLQAGELQLAPYICYEIVYPDFVAASARQADILLTISNDAWFGESIGPHQHLQIAQMRALETGRYVIRATNNGVSAIINPMGELVTQAPQFQRLVFSGEVTPRQGNTPFLYYGSTPVLGVCVLLLLTSGIRRSSPQPSVSSSRGQ